jgi:hypothetical protein
MFMEFYNDYMQDAMQAHGSTIISENKRITIERDVQKRAIMESTISALKAYPNIDASLIGKEINKTFIYNKTKMEIDPDIITDVVSAENSWKKSSGHAFEAMVQYLGNQYLNEHGIRLVLQKELKELITTKQINNQTPDLLWLNEKIGSSAFDLYSIVKNDDGAQVYGCIQSKTSIRDRVTRDREPSSLAMEKFFWSVAICLDGDFLKQPKFIYMVNGGSSDFNKNGWHGMYVFSEGTDDNRIYYTDVEMLIFVNHAAQAAKHWLTQRQWFNNDWRAE